MVSDIKIISLLTKRASQLLSIKDGESTHQGATSQNEKFLRLSERKKKQKTKNEFSFQHQLQKLEDIE